MGRPSRSSTSCHAVARLSRLVDRTFEGQRDVDWLARPDGTLRLVDIRPGIEGPAGPEPEPDVRAPAIASSVTTSV